MLSPLSLMSRPPPTTPEQIDLQQRIPLSESLYLPPLRERTQISRSCIRFVEEPCLPLAQVHHGSQPAFNTRKLTSNSDFESMCLNPAVTVNPKRMQFIPASAWTNDKMPFGVLVSTFFRKRNSMHCKFPYKLYNALKMSLLAPEFIPHIGIEWVTDTIFRVNRVVFARLLGVRTVEGGLFHQQGNFPSHGFVELPFDESDQISRKHGYGPADLSQVRFMKHCTGHFVRYSTEHDLEQCKWNGK